MRSQTSLLLSLCLLASLLAACGRTKDAPSGDQENTPPGVQEDTGVQEDNPFDYERPSDILGSVSHTLDVPEGAEGTLEYTGGELHVPYRADGEGTGRNVGFLLFLNGIPQPYRLNGEGEYAYMHPFTLREENVSERFSFDFIPVTGRAEETAGLTVADLFNASFEPDMVTSSDFGLYGNAVSTVYSVRFSADPEGRPEAGVTEALSGVAVTNELMTAQFAEDMLGEGSGMSFGDGETRADRLGDTVYIFDTCDGVQQLNDLELTGRDTLHVAVDLCGIPGVPYRVSFFADHVPLSDGENCFWDVTLEKGKTARVEADLDLRDLPAVTTFYAVACIPDGENENVRRYGLLKTNSIPIWFRDRLDAPEPEDGGGAEDAGEAAGTEVYVPEVLDETVRSLWYGGGDLVLARRSDGLLLLDPVTGQVLAEGPAPEMEGAVYAPAGDGFCAVGEAEVPRGAAAAPADGETALHPVDGADSSGDADSGDPAEKETVCVFLDSSLRETDRVSLTALSGEGHIMSAAVSPDGRLAAWSVMGQGIWLYSRDTGKASLLRAMDREHLEENGGVSDAVGLWFSGDSSRILFADNTHFGVLDADGGGYASSGFDGFDAQGPVGCSGGRIFFNENFFTASGAMAAADTETMTYAVYRHSAQEGNGDLYVSRDGGYFATTAFEERGVTVRVYGAEDDGLRLRYTFEDGNQDLFNRSPSVLILDSLKLCLMKFGGYADIPAKVLAVCFE